MSTSVQSPPTSSGSDIPKAILYGLDGATWTSAVQLALVEKGYGQDELEYRQVDVSKGEHFDPSYLRINLNATIPTLVVPLAKTLNHDIESRYKAITDTKSILEFLDKSRTVISRTHTTSHAPAPALAPATFDTLATSNAVIDVLQTPPASVNFLLLSAVTADELKAKASGFQGTYLSQRDQVLKTHLRPRGVDEAPLISRYKTVLEERKVKNDSFFQVYEQASNPDSPLVNEFFEKSRKAWEQDLKGVLDTLEKTIQHSHATLVETKQPAMVGPDAQTPEHAARGRDEEQNLAGLPKAAEAAKGPKATYVLGDQISLPDLHLFVWLARVVRVSGGDLSADGLKKVEARVNGTSGAEGWKIGEKIASFWAAMMERDSVKQVYRNGIH